MLPAPNARANFIRRQNGQERIQLQPLRLRPHPRRGGSHGYSHAHRQDCLQQANAHLPYTCSRRSITRWRTRILSDLPSGNKQTPKIHGTDQFALIMYRLAWPKCSADEMRAFLFRNGPLGHRILYSKADITKAENRIGLERKVGSTTAYQFETPLNLHRRHRFWTLPPPYGVVGVPIATFMDYDECMISLQTVNRRYGKAYVNVRVSESGPYSYTEKFTLKLAIDSNNFKHVNLTNDIGTTNQSFRAFFSSMLPRLVGGPPRTILMDNLSSHYDAVTWAMVHAAGHSFIPRPAYAGFDGPIEYVFNTIEGELRKRLYSIRNRVQLVAAVHDVIANLGSFRPYFLHCGY